MAAAVGGRARASRDATGSATTAARGSGGSEPSAGRAELRGKLIEAAARLIATEGAAALTLRRVADDVGTSTMAIYTIFGGMPELRRALRHEGFARLAEALARVAPGDDPVADLALMGRAYLENAMADPHLYRVTFLEQRLDDADAVVGSEAFAALVAGVERCIAAGRFGPADASALANRFWALGHGVITLGLANLLGPAAAVACLEGAVLDLFRSWGDDTAAAERSLARSRKS